MSLFVNTFDFGIVSVYRSIVGADAAGFRVVGLVGDGGLFAAIDADGATVWQKHYTIQRQAIHFWSGTRCDNGDFMLHGSLAAGIERNQSLIVRVTPGGEVRWAKTYTRDRTRFNIRLVKGIRDTYFFTSWYNESSSLDDVEVVKIDGAGNVLAAVSINSGGDDQVNAIIPFNDGCIVLGGTSSGPGWDCFAVALNGNLQVVWKKLIGDIDFQEARHIVQTGPQQFVITGETGPNRNTFMAALSTTATQANALVYDLKSGDEAGPKCLLFGASRIYLAATAPAAPPASFVACFNLSLELLWQRRLALPGSCSLLDLQGAGDDANGLVVCGAVTGTAPAGVSLLARTDADFASCVTADLPRPRAAIVQFQVRDWVVKVSPMAMTVTAQPVRAQDLTPVRAELCPQGVPLDLSTHPRYQSPYVYLQAAGSDGSDATVRGFHLRWDLLRGLGAAHLPKGNLAAPGGPWPTAIGYNRADDFVHVYRTELRNDYGVDVQFEKPPTSLFESGAVREWLYEDLVPSPGRSTDVSIRFADVAQYDALRARIDPRADPKQLIASYTGVVEARAVGKLAFLASFQLLLGKPELDQRLRVEALTLPDPLDNTSRTLGCRRSFARTASASITCENIESIRFDYRAASPVSLHIATYEDFLHASNARREWFKVGDYSLDDGRADADAAVFRRLEDPPKVVIDGVWPKFQRVSAPGVFRVKAKNYRDRWRLPADGLKQAVTTYLDASRTDVEARVVVASSDPVANASAVELSYLDLLNFVALDFHVARMLGLGAIDAHPTVGRDIRFLYLMQYVTDARLAQETPARVTHYYMTPPMRVIDFKKPPAPTISLSYGLPPEPCEGTTSALTDAAGYARFDDARFVNLDRAPFRYELPIEPFFQSAAEFCLCDETVPVSFGVSYGPGPIGAGNEVQPELSHNPDWRDPASVPEVSPIPERGANPVYTHQERTPGIHHYRLYSINWFSRIGETSPEVQTDATHFARRNTLLAPANFAVQLIQKEDPRIFTSLAEQTRLASLPPGDRTLVRVTFDWNYVHNQAYQSADKVELYFRTQPPATVRGRIASVTEDAAAHTVTIATASYLIASTDPPQTVQPQITGNASRFVGARLAVDGQSWRIASVPQAGLHPTLVLEQIRSTASVDVDQDNSFCTVESWISPKAGDRFLIVENLDNPDVWDTKLDKEVSLAKFLPLYTETIVHNDGQSRTLHLGGLSDAALVENVPDPDPNIGGFVPANGPAVVPSGAYTVTFATRQLPAIADPDVDFHEGVIRMPDLNGDVKVLRVWSIGQKATTHQLQLTVYDSTFGLERDPVTGMFLLDALHRFVPVSGYVPVRTGNVGTVNFHPSYRVYLTADDAGTHNFGEPAILPARDERSRQTLMTARARDSSVAPALTSPMAKPGVLLALELRDPVPPGPPLGPLFATRPNFYGKATYTVDVQVDDPYSLIFFKVNDRKILDQLYQPSTVRSIVAQLDGLSEYDRSFTAQRWHDLVHVVTGADGNFIEHALNGFQFPIPDNPDYAIPDPRPDPPVVVKPFNANTLPPGSSTLVPGTTRTMKDVVQEAIEGAFVPLTELPLVYRQLADTTMQTSGRPPKLRNANGDRLPPGQDDPWPMAVRFEKNADGDLLQRGDAGYGDPANTRWVRFTDYTLDGASKNLYFYFAVELAITLKTSGRSPVTGPVQLINAAPPEAPVIRKVIAQLDDGLDLRPRVLFELSGYLPSEGVTSYKLYRCLDPDDALSVRTMTEVKEFPVDAAAFYDDFADLADVPFAQPLFYRVVAFRQILNEQGEDEIIPSKPSEPVTISVADTVHPAPPQIAMSSSPLTPTHPMQYSNVILSWPRTTYNGSYHLYKMNELGTWVKIHTVESNAPVIQVDLQDTTLASGVLVKEDAAGNTLYHRFRVMALSSSGLINLEQSELTV